MCMKKKRIDINLTPAQIDWLKRTSARTGLGVSEYLRRIVDEKIEKEREINGMEGRDREGNQ